MATPSGARPGRTIAVLAALIVLIYGLILVVAPDTIGKQTLSIADKFKPRLGLDLEGGTSVILTPRLVKGGGSPPKDSLNQAVSIIRNRVDGFGVAEAEVTTAGDNIVISIPGKQDKSILKTVQQTAQLRFRPVWLAGAGAATPQPTAVPEPDGERRRVTQRDRLPERHGLAAGDRHAQPDDEQQQRRGPQGAAQGDHHPAGDARTRPPTPTASPGLNPSAGAANITAGAGPAVRRSSTAPTRKPSVRSSASRAPTGPASRW